MKNSMEDPQTLKIKLPYNLEIPFLGICPKKKKTNSNSPNEKKKSGKWRRGGRGNRKENFEITLDVYQNPLMATNQNPTEVD